MQRSDAAINVVTAVAAAAATTATAEAAIPSTSAGVLPLKIRVASTAAAYIKLGVTGMGAATSADILVQPGDSVILKVPKGTGFFRVIRSTADGTVNIAALEDS